jgi:hypothetical protein
MTGTNCDIFTHNQSRSYLNHIVLPRNGAGKMPYMEAVSVHS